MYGVVVVLEIHKFVWQDITYHNIRIVQLSKKIKHFK